MLNGYCNFFCKIVPVAHFISHSPSNKCAQANKQINRVKCRSTTLRVERVVFLRVFVFVIAICANTFTDSIPFAPTLPFNVPLTVLFWTSLCLYISRTTPFYFCYYITSIVSRQISFNNLLMYAMTTIYVNKMWPNEQNCNCLIQLCVVCDFQEI